MSIKGRAWPWCSPESEPKCADSRNLSEFLRDSTNKMALFQYPADSVMQRSHSGDITTDMYYVTTVRHVIPVEEMRTVCNEQEADADHTSHHTCSELRIIEHSGQYI